MMAWQRLTPPADMSEFEALDSAALRARNKYLDYLFTILMFVRLIPPFAFICNASSAPHALALFGLGFGPMVDLPVAVIAGMTPPYGDTVCRDFAKFGGSVKPSGESPSYLSLGDRLHSSMLVQPGGYS